MPPPPFEPPLTLARLDPPAPLTVVALEPYADDGPALPLEVEVLRLFLPPLPDPAAFGVIDPDDDPGPEPALAPPWCDERLLPLPVVCFARLSAYFEMPGIASHAFVNDEARNESGGGALRGVSIAGGGLSPNLRVVAFACALELRVGVFGSSHGNTGLTAEGSGFACITALYHSCVSFGGCGYCSGGSNRAGRFDAEGSSHTLLYPAGIGSRIWNDPSRGGDERDGSHAMIGGEVRPAATAGGIGIGAGFEGAGEGGRTLTAGTEAGVGTPREEAAADDDDDAM